MKLKLEKKCSYCKGKGKIFEVDPDRLRKCQICEGHGWMLTSQGMQILKFVEKWNEEVLVPAGDSHE